MIEIFNSLVKQFRDDFDFNEQIQVEFEVHGMHVELHHFVNSSRSPLHDMLNGLCKLRMNRDLLLTFKLTKGAIIDRDDEESGETCYQIFSRFEKHEKGVLPNTIFAAQYADLMFISLPSATIWGECGLEWLNTYCSYCCTAEVESAPWSGPQCECPNRRGDAGG